MQKRISILAVCSIFVCLIVATALVSAGIIRPPDSSPQIDSSKLYKVTYIDDGDTIRVDIDAREARVRLLGINTPETVDPRKKVECYGPEASTETKSLLKGRAVRLVLNADRESTDKYGRYLAYVYRDDGLFVNAYLLQEGFAREYTVGTPYSFQAGFRAIEAKARHLAAGLWNACQDRT
jgi:micrococcal nuclease